MSWIDAEQQGEQPDASDRLPAGALQLVVDLGVLELLQIERGRVSHELHAGAIGEEVAQQALEQRGDPRQPLTDQGDGQLDGRAARRCGVHGIAAPLAARPTARTTSSTMSLPIQSTPSGTSARRIRRTRMPTT